MMCLELGVLIKETGPTEIDSLIDSIKGLLFMNQYILDIRSLVDFMNLNIQKLSRNRPEPPMISDANEEVIASLVNPYILSLQELIEHVNMNPDRHLTIRELVMCMTVATKQWSIVLDYQNQEIRDSIQSAHLSLRESIEETNRRCDEIAKNADHV